MFFFFFFFSSRRRHTRSDRDWSSDVCSSDLLADHGLAAVLGAADRGGKRGRFVDHLAARVAEADREQPLVGDDPVEKAQDLGARTLAHEILERLLDRVGDEGGAHVQVANEPLERESVDEWYDRVRDGCERNGEGKDEAKRQSHASSCRVSCSPPCGKRGIRDNVTRTAAAPQDGMRRRDGQPREIQADYAGCVDSPRRTPHYRTRPWTSRVATGSSSPPRSALEEECRPVTPPIRRSSSSAPFRRREKRSLRSVWAPGRCSTSRVTRRRLRRQERRSRPSSDWAAASSTARRCTARPNR